MFKNLLQAIIDRIKGCQHEWEEIGKINWTHPKYPDYVMGNTWTYRCKKCCESKIISNK